MRITGFVPFVFAALVSFFSANAHAGDGWIDEARFGGAIIDIPTFTKQPYYEYNRAGANVEVLFSPVSINFLDIDSSSSFVQELLTPRPHLGATIALEENTTSSIYAGLTWHHELTDLFFLETSFGGAVHNGEMKNVKITPIISRRAMGSPVLFRESIALGMKVTDNINALVQVSHMSHAGLAGDDNAGQTDLAFKLGFKF